MILTALVVILVVVGYLGCRRFLPSHPRFGPVYETAAFDLNESRSDPVGIFLRKHLPRRIVQSPRFPIRYREQARHFDLKGAQLEWSIGGTNTGWLYFWDGDIGSRSLVWEFAPCAETNLLGVREVPAAFFGSADPRREEVFGDTSTSNAINVAVGQILFARHTASTNTIYIMKLKEQDGNKLVVDYCVARR